MGYRRFWVGSESASWNFRRDLLECCGRGSRWEGFRPRSECRLERPRVSDLFSGFWFPNRTRGSSRPEISCQSPTAVQQSMVGGAWSRVVDTETRDFRRCRSGRIAGCRAEASLGAQIRSLGAQIKLCWALAFVKFDLSDLILDSGRIWVRIWDPSGNRIWILDPRQLLILIWYLFWFLGVRLLIYEFLTPSVTFELSVSESPLPGVHITGYGYGYRYYYIYTALVTYAVQRCRSASSHMVTFHSRCVCASCYLLLFFYIIGASVHLVKFFILSFDVFASLYVLLSFT
ncbi:hypothetical protein RchiOBHm_Chr3g0476931 [Rosa chinensis]|uniref:Uncharacterized protein n=1 Tax=Rosa chinensis TaxID=74649 RepID=A0A2P6RCU0_ROSCH|nr:hypothetical protein RchiOBHm_Chr3g0476931 [Rosa chinensis]